MCKFKVGTTLIKAVLCLVLFIIVNTKQAFPMKDPLQEQLGNLKSSISELKIKLGSLTNKLTALKENLKEKIIDPKSMGMFEQTDSSIVGEVATFLSPKDIAQWQQTARYFKRTLEAKFTMDEKTKCIIAPPGIRWNAQDLANFDHKSILITHPHPHPHPNPTANPELDIYLIHTKAEIHSNAEIRFTRTNVENKQRGPLGKYDKLEIKKTFAKDVIDKQMSDSGHKYKYDTVSLLIGIFSRCNWKNKNDRDHKLKEISIDASGLPLSRLVLRNLINLTKFELFNCDGVKILYIEQCPNLNINEFIRCFANLENLYLRNCTRFEVLDLSQCPNLKRLILEKTNLVDQMIIGAPKLLKIERPTCNPAFD